MRAIDLVALIKKLRVKANSKPNSEIISAIQKRDKPDSSYKKSGLER